MRSTQEVIEHHLECRRSKDLEADLAVNYHIDVVVLSHEGVNIGHDGVREVASVLEHYVEADRYEVVQLITEGRFAYLRWHIDGDESEAHDGVDTFVVEDGRIVAQTIHYGLD